MVDGDSIEAFELVSRVRLAQSDWQNAALPLAFLCAEELHLLLDDFGEFARPEEVLEHGRGDLGEKHPHESEETAAGGLHLLSEAGVVELEVFVGGQKANLRDDQQLQHEGLLDFRDELGPVLKHQLGYLAEQQRFLAKDSPVLLAEADELLMLDLVVLDHLVQLSLVIVLVCRLLGSVLHHQETLADPVELVLEHYDTFEVDLAKQKQINEIIRL